MQGIPGQHEGTRSGLVPQTPERIYKLIQQYVDNVHFPVLMFGPIERKHQLIPGHLQVGRGIYPRLHSKIWASHPNKLIFTAWTWSCRTSKEASGLLPFSFSLYPWILPQQWKNCNGGQISIPHWRIISMPPPRQ